MLTRFSENVNNHQSLPDKPSITANALKVLFDKAPNDIKDYINSTLLVELDSIISGIDSGKLGVSENAVSATKLKNARTIALSGGATGTATSFDGTANIAIPVTSLDASKLTGTASVPTTGNAGSATKLKTARTINGTSFDGSGNITTSKWGTSRKLTLSGAVSGSANIDGSGNVTINTSLGNIAVLEGSFTPSSNSHTIQRNYPSGYSRDNCIILSFCLTVNNMYTVYEFISGASFQKGIQLESNHILMRFQNLQAMPCSYKVVLMKIS